MKKKIWVCCVCQIYIINLTYTTYPYEHLWDYYTRNIVVVYCTMTQPENRLLSNYEYASELCLVSN